MSATITLDARRPLTLGPTPIVGTCREDRGGRSCPLDNAARPSAAARSGASVTTTSADLTMLARLSQALARSRAVPLAA